MLIRYFSYKRIGRKPTLSKVYLGENEEMRLQKTLFPSSFQLKQKIASLIPSRPMIVDVGCGDGDLLEMLSDRGNELFGVDVSEKSTREAKRRVPCGCFVVGDAQNLPFKPNALNVALIVETLEHLKDPSKAVEEAHRILRKGGILVTATPQGWLDYYFLKYPNHVHFFSKTKLKIILEREGLSVKLVASGFVPSVAGLWRFKWGWKVREVLAKLMPFLSTHFITVSLKR